MLGKKIRMERVMNRNPRKAVSEIVHKNYKVETAMKVLEESPIISPIFSTGTPIW